MAATYKWDLQTIGELTLSQVMLLWFYYNRRISKWVSAGVDFVNNLFGGPSGKNQPQNMPRSSSRLRGPLPKTAYQPLEMIELSPETMRKAAEYVQKARENKQDMPKPEGKVTAYRENGIIRKVVEKPKDKKNP